ncbi:hypothetical protein RintRC_2628 [Richelia intracellularis]|nr:hypothetical protein RintRC_2628 [Richelia intracellularis]
MDEPDLGSINWHIVKFLADDKDYQVKTQYTKDIQNTFKCKYI